LVVEDSAAYLEAVFPGVSCPVLARLAVAYREEAYLEEAYREEACLEEACPEEAYPEEAYREEAYRAEACPEEAYPAAASAVHTVAFPESQAFQACLATAPRPALEPEPHQPGTHTVYSLPVRVARLASALPFAQTCCWPSRRTS